MTFSPDGRIHYRKEWKSGKNNNNSIVISLYCDMIQFGCQLHPETEGTKKRLEIIFPLRKATSITRATIFLVKSLIREAPNGSQAFCWVSKLLIIPTLMTTLKARKGRPSYLGEQNWFNLFPSR